MRQKAEALRRIADVHDGVLTPDDVVAEAKNPKHPLHQCFPWDDQIAAHERRLDVARHLIASVEVIVETEDVVVTGISYIHDVRKGRKTQGYITLDALSKRRDDARTSVELELEAIIGRIERARLISGGLGLANYFEAMLANAIQAKIRVQRKKKAA
jgi:hypothetical protein